MSQTPKPAHIRRQTSLSSLNSTSENIQVVVRVRPLDSPQSQPSWQVPHDATSIICIDSDEIGDDLEQSEAGLRYNFDHVFDAGTSTSELYKCNVTPLLDSFLSGVNGTIMTYGQTGSGKTFTLTGTSTCPGVSTMLVQDILQKINQPDISNRTYQLLVSYFEIYNEEVYDLLASKTRKGESLRIRENSDGVYIERLEKKNVTNIEEIHNLLKRGAQNRSVAATVWNHESSRSHSIMSIELEVCHRRQHDDTEIRRRSVLNVVDLAGSERIAKYSTDKSVDALVRQKEGGNINKSLYSLTSVVSHLAQGSSHIPYRNSRLTRILQPSLGGNSRTLICVCASAAKHNIHETISSLKFAALAKTIHNQYSVNISSTKIGSPRIKEHLSESNSSSISVSMDQKSGQDDNFAQLDLLRQDQEHIQHQHDLLKTSLHDTIDVLNAITKSFSSGLQISSDLEHDHIPDHALPIINVLIKQYNQYLHNQQQCKQLNDELQRACTTLLQYSTMLQRRLESREKILDQMKDEMNDRRMIMEEYELVGGDNECDNVIEQYDDLVYAMNCIINSLHVKYTNRRQSLLRRIHHTITALDLDPIQRHNHLLLYDHGLVRDLLSAQRLAAPSDNHMCILLDIHRHYQEQMGHYDSAILCRDQFINKLVNDIQELRNRICDFKRVSREKHYTVKEQCDRYQCQCEILLRDQSRLEREICDFKNEAERITSMNTSLVATSATLSDQITDLRYQLTTEQQRVADLQETTLRLEQQLELASDREQRLLLEQQHQEIQIRTLRSAEIKLNTEIEQLHDRQLELEQCHSDNQEIVQLLRQTESDLRHDVQIRDEREHDLTEKIAALTKRESILRSELEAQDRHSEEQIKQLSDREVGLRHDIQVCEQREHDLKEEISALTKRESNLRNELEGQNRHLEEQIKQLSDREVGLRHDIQDREQREHDLMEEISALTKRESNLRNEMETQNCHLENQIMQLCNREADLRHDIQNREQREHDLKGEISSLTKRESDLRIQMEAQNYQLKDQVMQLSNRVADLYQDIQVREEREHGLKAEILALIKHESDLRNEMESYDERKCYLEGQIRESTSREADLRHDLQAREECQLALQDDLKQLRQRESDLMQQLECSRELEHQLRQTHDEQSDQIKSLRKKHEEWRDQLQSIHVHEQDLVHERDQLQIEVRTLRQQSQDYLDQYHSCHSDLQRIKSDTDQRFSEIKESHENVVQCLSKEHEATSNELSRQLQSLSGRLTELQSKYTLLELRNDEIMIAYDTIRDRYETQRQRYDDLQNQLKQSETDRMLLNKSEMTLQQRVQLLIDEKTSQAEDHDRDLQELRDRLKQVRSQLATDEKRIDQYEHDLDKKRHEVKELQQYKEAVDSRMTEKSRELDLCHARIQELQHRLAQKQNLDQDQIIQMQDQLQDLKHRYEQSDNNLTQLQLDHDQLTNDMDRIRLELDEAIRKRDQLQLLLDCKEQDLIASKKRQSEMELQIERSSQQMSDLRTDLQNTKISARRAANELKRDKIRSDTAHSVKLAQLRNEIEMFNSENNDLSAELALSKALLGFQKNVIEYDSVSGTSSGKRSPILVHSRSSSVSPRPPTTDIPSLVNK